MITLIGMEYQMSKVKLGFIGLGQRGNGLLSNVLHNFKDVEITAVCDNYADRVEQAAKRISDERKTTAAKYVSFEDLLKDENVNTVIISAAWEAHVPVAVAAMRAGKIVGLEVGGAYSVDDCWELVKAYEQTKTPFMFLENCCYGETELLITNMVRKGVFGEVVYCHGSYCHDLRYEICGGIKNRHYRLRNYLTRNCDNYPTHQLGPIAKLLNINRGNRMLSLVSLSSKSRGLEEYVKGKEEYAFLHDKHFAQGDVVQTLIRCADGALISLKLDTTLPRAYSREFSVSGTRAVFNEQGNVLLVDGEFNHEKGMNEFLNTADKFKDKYLPRIWKDITQEQRDAGHGGMDTFLLQAFFEAILNETEMPIDVYDAAAWMSITCLSEASIAAGGRQMEIPDFTRGKWVLQQPKDVIEFD